ncbi:MAG: hypothetical protein HY903_12250 [Deltaproteobacteria bacterium]|nr:hypothetical protein [Deltaproteobacteria bacterium]
MPKISADAGMKIHPRFESAPSRTARAGTKLLKALGKAGKALDFHVDVEERIVFRMEAVREREVEALLCKAGVKKQNTGIRDVYSFDGVEVVISPFGRIMPC